MQKVTKYDLKGQVADFPLEVLQKMCEYQKVFDPSIFQNFRIDGLDWDRTTEGHDFWTEVILRKNFALFFEKYPKVSEYPQIMWVWNVDRQKKRKRVVFMEKCGKFLAWNGAETFEEAENKTFVDTWNLVEPIETITKKEAEKILGKTII